MAYDKRCQDAMALCFQAFPVSPSFGVTPSSFKQKDPREANAQSINDNFMIVRQNITKINIWPRSRHDNVR